MHRLFRLSVFVACAALAGCATTEGYQQHMDLLRGSTGDAIQQQWGVPDQTSRLSDGSDLWVYHRTTEMKSGGYETTRTATRVEEYTDKDGKKQKRTVTYSEPYYEPVQVTRTHCETRFTLSRNVVTAVTFEGDGCVAEELDKKN